MRRAHRLDANHTEVVSALLAAGCKVQSLAGMAGGVPDILVGTPYHPRRLILMEIKDGTRSPSEQVLTKDEVLWHRHWYGYEVYVCNSVESALRAVGA